MPKLLEAPPPDAGTPAVSGPGLPAPAAIRFLAMELAGRGLNAASLRRQPHGTVLWAAVADEMERTS